MPRPDDSRALGRNPALKATALLVAIGLWIFVNAGQREAQSTIQVPVKYRGLPPGLMIVSPHPDFVALEVSGPGTLLSLLDPGRLALKLDLNGVVPGQTDFKIGPQLFNVPRQTSIDRITPAAITLEIDRVTTREVPVHAVFKGPPPAGYAIGDIELKPAAVTVSGPQRAISQLDQIDTEPIDISSATNDLNKSIELNPPGGLVRMAEEVVEARVAIHELLTDREFRGVQVAVREANFKYRVQPRQVSVTVRGPARRLSSLSLDGVVFVNAQGAAPGIHELPVQVELPGGIEVVRQAPERVKLRLSAEKAGARS
jgi:YbbR domain-containing protein